MARTGGRGGTIRWDRVGRITLSVVLGVIVLLYISPLSHWITQSATASEQESEVRRLERENGRLRTRVARLSRPQDVEREARRLGMVRRGERPFVIQGAPAR